MTVNAKRCIINTHLASDLGFPRLVSLLDSTQLNGLKNFIRENMNKQTKMQCTEY